MKPWIEKYRPKNLSEIKGHKHLKEILYSFESEGDFPHILLHGPQGSGKTATIRAFLKEFYKDTFRDNVIEHNSSHHRGIDFIRNDLIKQCQGVANGEYKFRTIFFCEIDGLTSDAQFALRRTMETYSRNVRFVADCNDINKIIKPIRSRFFEYYVRKLPYDDVVTFLDRISLKEKLEISKDFKVAQPIYTYIFNATDGDLRAAVNLLQSVSHLEEITVEILEEISPFPDKIEVHNLIELNRNGSSFESREEVLMGIMRKYGYRADEILKQIYEWYYKDYDGDFKPQILLEIGEFINRMATLHVPNVIQLRSCLERIKQIEGILSPKVPIA
jgi:replication factor C small subunit